MLVGRRLALSVSLLLSLGASPLTAQSTAPYLTVGTRHMLRSTVLGGERQVVVSLPDDYAIRRSKRYPVLVVLDAQDQFRSAVASARFLASRGAVPDLIIVGIPNGKDRTHDLTPKLVGRDSAKYATAGGADAFVAFIGDEVLPWVDARYRTLPLRVLSGHSFGGLFALHAAATRPSLFRVTLALSPSLWWSDSASATDYATRIARDSVGPRTIFVASGALEPVIDGPTHIFLAELGKNRRPELELQYRHYPSDGHGTTPLYGFADGLRTAFAPLTVPADSLYTALTTPTPRDSATFVEAFDAAAERYASAARRLGLAPELPEPTREMLGYIAMEAHPGLALSIFRDNVNRFPTSANAHNLLGDALLAAGDSAAATVQLQGAVRLAAWTHDPVGEEAKGKLEALRRRGRKGAAAQRSR